MPPPFNLSPQPKHSSHFPKAYLPSITSLHATMQHIILFTLLTSALAAPTPGVTCSSHHLPELAAWEVAHVNDEASFKSSLCEQHECAGKPECILYNSDRTASLYSTTTVGDRPDCAAAIDGILYACQGIGYLVGRWEANGQVYEVSVGKWDDFRK